MRNGWWKPICKYNLDLKMTYENKWELKPNYKHKWRLKSTYEYKWIMKMDYKYKWDIFLDYMMKNHDIHENKNPCPEFNGEKMHEHQSGCWVVKKTLILQGFLALTIWKNQRKSLVDTKLIPPLSRDRIIQKSLKARKFVFLKTNLRAFFTVILRILWNTMKRGANKNFSKIFVDTVDFYPLKFRISERTWNLITI